MKQHNDKDNRGTGHGADYTPCIKVSDFGSLGTCSNPIDWQTGRTVHLLSQGEAMLWHRLRWDERTADVREQYPLSLKDTLRLCDQYGIHHPNNRKTPMTTDFLVTLRDGGLAAYSLKDNRSELEKPRTVQKLFIEKCYWLEQGVPFRLLFKSELNVILSCNIRQIVEYYDSALTHDDISILKHLIATRKIVLPELATEILNYPELLKIHRKEVDEWKNYKLKSE